MATITNINTATDTPASAATKTNTNLANLNAEVVANNAKVGITPAQASAITANTAKVSADGSINTHSDVDTVTTPPANDNVLAWNSSTEKWEPSVLDVSTQSQFFPVSVNNMNNTLNPYNANLNEHSLATVNSQVSAYINFYLPSHASSLLRAEIVMIPDATETIQADFFLNYATSGQASTTHTPGASNQSLAVTAGQMTFWNITNISPLFTDLQPNDVGGLRINSDTTQIRILGLILTWTI